MSKKQNCMCKLYTYTKKKNLRGKYFKWYVVFHADRITCQWSQRILNCYNIANEVVMVIVGQQFRKRDIVIYNPLNLSGFPKHFLTLKVGTPIILLKNPCYLSCVIVHVCV